MIVTGRYTSAEVFTDNIEEAALQWVREQCDSPAFDGVRIAQMPDVHAGNSCNVGTVYRIGPYVNPDHVGVDIGCTVSMHRLTATVSPEDFALLDHRIRETVPTGTEICEKNSINEKELFRFLNSHYQRARSVAPDLIDEAPRIDVRYVTDFCRRIKLQEGIFYKSLGTLGGGNHFIEYGEDDTTGEGWLTCEGGEPLARHRSQSQACAVYRIPVGRRAPRLPLRHGAGAGIRPLQSYRDTRPHPRYPEKALQGQVHGVGIHDPQLHLSGRRLTGAAQGSYRCLGGP